MTSATLILLCILAGVLGGMTAAAMYHSRQVAAMRALFARLEEVAKTAERTSSSAEEPGDAFPGTAPAGESSLSAATADVLAGQTTHIRELLENGAARGLPLADQAIVRILAHLEDPLSPSDVAQSLNVSLRSLERGLSLALDCTPRELILAVKMREARRLLDSGELNVTGVAYHLGFSSPSHFSRRFREFFRRSPSEAARRVA